MKLLVVAVISFVTLAQAEIDWSTIRPKHIHVQPIRPAPTPRIVGGEEAEPHGVSYQVSVVAGGAFCGGSIIRSNVVLTAAHCVDGAHSAQITAGAHYIQQNEESQQVIGSSKIIVHADWDSWKIRNDIALVILSSDIKLDTTASIVALNEESSSLDGEEAIVSGWGRPSDSAGSISPVLRYAIENIISNKECFSYYGSYITDTNVCLDGRNGKGACNGDSGGPLFVARNDKPVQAGIVSFGSSAGCESGYPSAYTRVSEFTSWINKNLP